MSTTATEKKHVTAMGYSVVLTESGDGGYRVIVGGRPIRKKNGEEMVYRGLAPALGRFGKEVAAVEGWEARLREKGLRHPVVLCAGGCGLEMRVSDRTYPDGRVETVEEILANGSYAARCVACGPFPPVVFFKDEDEDEDGTTMGPAWVIPYRDRQAFAEGKENSAQRLDEGGWVTRDQAKAYAEELGATFATNLFEFAKPRGEVGRTILVHLNVTLPKGDERPADVVADAVLAAISVGAWDDIVSVVAPLAEEV